MLTNLGPHDLITVLATMLISLSAHEAMHAFVAHALGDTTAQEQGRLTLNPLKHIDVVMTVLLPILLLALHMPLIFVAKPVPFDPSRVRFGEYGAALVALAGPFTNLVLAVIASLLIRLDPGFSQVLAIFMQINLAFFVFNLIPIPPLDGSRLIYAFAPEGLQRIMAQVEQVGFILTIGILLVLSPIIGPLVSNITQSIFTFLLR